jgi:hypothetical protein
VQMKLPQGMVLSGCAVCFILPIIIIQCQMWMDMFTSDKACGPELWSFGFVMILLACCQCCTCCIRRPVAGRNRPSPTAIARQ